MIQGNIIISIPNTGKKSKKAIKKERFNACLFIHFFLTILFLFHQSLIQRKKENLYATLISSFTETFIIIIKTYSILFVITFIGLFLGFQVIDEIKKVLLERNE